MFINITLSWSRWGENGTPATAALSQRDWWDEQQLWLNFGQSSSSSLGEECHTFGWPAWKMEMWQLSNHWHKLINIVLIGGVRTWCPLFLEGGRKGLCSKILQSLSPNVPRKWETVGLKEFGTSLARLAMVSTSYHKHYSALEQGLAFRTPVSSSSFS